MKKILVFAMMAALSLGLLTACGSGGGSAQDAGTIVLGENGQYAYSPNEITVNKGTVKITLQNKDTASAHSFLIPDFNVNSGQIPAGQSKTITFNASKTGDFDFSCDVPGHKEGGMVGKLHVK